MTKPIFLLTSPEDLSREGLTETIQPWEDGMRADTGRGSLEWWYFDAHLDDGSTAVIFFATKSILKRNGPLRPEVSLTITRPDGTKVVESPVYAPDTFQASKETCDVRIADSWVRGDLHRYQLHAETGKLAADLTFTGIVPPWRPGAGKTCFGTRKQYFAWLPAIPHGTVSGTLTYDGKTVAVNGTGYHDHNWGNVSLNTVMDHWYWGRAHLGDFTVIFVEKVMTPAYGSQKIPIFMLAKGNRILTGDNRSLRLEKRDFVTHSGGREYPRQLDFIWESEGRSVHLALRQPQPIEAISLLTLFSPWQQKILRLFANPYYFRFNADLELTIDYDEIQAHERGPALYEIMMLK